jgi:xyloglucan:xyloglucosyl transferase
MFRCLLQLSNGDVYEKTHDELDFEFLGSRWGGQWRVQTNVYGNGSTSHGREERYLLPFDPTLEAHRYSVLWAPTHIMYVRALLLMVPIGSGRAGRTLMIRCSCSFYIDDTPIREVIRHPDMGGDFPAKPMAVYATIWDGSAWATEGGKYKVNYKYAPFASEFSDLAVVGPRADPVLRVPRRGVAGADQEDLLELMTADYAVMTPQKRAAMRAFRARQMTYTVCYDAVRYASGPFPECDNSDEERESFSAWGESKTVVMRPRARGRRRGRKAGAGARARSDVASS